MDLPHGSSATMTGPRHTPDLLGDDCLTSVQHIRIQIAWRMCYDQLHGDSGSCYITLQTHIPLLMLHHRMS